MTKKNAFFEGWSWFKFDNLRLALDTNLKFYTNVPKGLKLKVRKFSGLIPTFVEVTREKLIGGLFAPPSWITLRNNPYFAVPIVKSVHKGLESLSYLGPKIWELLPLEIKETETFSQFKAKIKKWNPKNCPCRLCKIYLQNVGFI